MRSAFGSAPYDWNTLEDLKKTHTLADLPGRDGACAIPKRGCPWMKSWTIAPYTIEEAYEVADAIERGDMDGLVDELGDLLLHITRRWL